MIRRTTAVMFACCLAAGILLAAASISHAAGERDPSQPEQGSAAPTHTEELAAGTVEGDSENAENRDTAPETLPEEIPAAEDVTPPLTLEAIRMVSFEDVSPEDSRADSIYYAAYQGMLSGVDENRFDPEGWVTLAAALTAFHRLSGEPAPAYGNTFPDVAEGQWYTDAVAWAANAGIVTGQSSGKLCPLEPVTRAQLAALFYRFAAFEDGKAYDPQLSAYTDGASVPEYARLPLAWALENRIFAGLVSDTIHPGLPVSRAQLAQVLVAYAAYDSEEPVAAALTTQMGAKIAVSSSLNHEEVQLLVDKTASKYGAAGLQVAVVEDGKVTGAYTYGYAEKDSTPMTPEHKIRCASITKVAVGMAAMLLREQGYIDLDTDIGAYWGVRVRNPKYPDIPITIRTLLTHTSSIRAFNSESRNYGPVKSQISSPSGFTSAKPGAISSWNYNNYGFAVLGMTLELASGKYLDTVMDENLWSIMEIDAAFEGGRVGRTDLIASLYQNGSLSRSAAAQANYHPKDTPGGTGAYFPGGLTISALDLAKMAALLANDGYYEGLQLIKPASVALMETRSTVMLGDGTYQALPLRSQDKIYGRDTLYYHTGSAYGVYNLFSYDPVEKDGVVVLTSGASGVKDDRGIYAICGEISQYIYGAVQ